MLSTAVLVSFIALFTVTDAIIELGRANREGDMLLIGGKVESEGNILIYHASRWGFVCDDYWNRWSGLVACKQLGYPGIDKITTKSHFPVIERRMTWMDNVECKGTENYLWDCKFNGWGRHNCGSGEAAGVVCLTSLTTPAPSTTPAPIQKDEPKRTEPVEYKIVGLKGGTSYRDGYVVIEIDGRRGTICADKWTLLEAERVCSHLGLHHASRAYKSSVYGGVNEDKVLGGVVCKGHEAELSECYHGMVLDEVICPRSGMIAGVSCAKDLADLIPDAPQIEKSLYVQDKPLFYMACAMEEGCAAKSAYTIRRTSRDWHVKHRRLLRFSSNVHNNGTADFRPFIPKRQWEWHTCHRHYHSMEVFATYNIVDKHNNKVADGHKASFCLEDSGGCNKGYKRKYYCDNYGDQGISVGCADLYAHDIDCQWIDITDVRPGRYLLKIHVNPENKVAELNYDNNVATCNLYFNGVSARATNCRVTKE